MEKLKDDLSNYDAKKFVKPSVTVDINICTIKDGKLMIMQIKRKKPPFRGWWAVPGGFLEVPKKETLFETASRELGEETGAKNIHIEQLKTYGDPGRDPREFAKNGTRVISVGYFALVPYELIEKQKIKAGDDADEVRWIDLREICAKIQKNWVSAYKNGKTIEDVRLFAFDHDVMYMDLLMRLEGKISYTPIAFSLVTEKFTWFELQNVYEAVLGKELLKPNFRRKVLSMYNIKEYKSKYQSGKRGRPAVYLKYNGTKKVF